MPKSQTKLSNIQTVLPPYCLLLATTLDRYCETCYENKDIKIDETCLCQNCNVFLCTPCHDVHKQMPSLLRLHIFLCRSCHDGHKKVPSLQNHRIIRGSMMPKSQTKLSNIQTVTHIMLVTSCNTMDSYCETCYDNNKDKKKDEICLCKDCNILLCRPCHVIHKQVRSLQKHRILRRQICKIYRQYFFLNIGCQHITL